MKKELLNLISLFLFLSATAQNLPPCFSKKSNGVTNSPTFLNRIYLSGGNIVYKFKLMRGRCMDCPSGVVYYDSACRLAASFTMGRITSVHIADGYQAKDFPENNEARYHKNLLSRNALPVCITSAIAKADSLKNANIISIKEVLIKNRLLYYFEQKTAPNGNQCYDCETQFTYYDSACNKVTTFTIGGVAGTRGTNGFTATDYNSKITGKTLWSAGQSTESTATSRSSAKVPLPFTKPSTYAILKIADDKLKGFALPGDRITISAAAGIQIFRKGKLVNRYKIIPQKITEESIITQTEQRSGTDRSKEDKVIYYLEPYKRYFQIVNNTFMVTNETYKSSYEARVINQKDWIVIYQLQPK